MNEPVGKLREVALTLKAIHARDDLAAARLCHIAGTRWSIKRYLNMALLKEHNAFFA